MANPFGGSDQALSKNTGHTNQANLLYAVIPRTTTKFREVITATDWTVSGAYDADGYWTPGSNTVARYTQTISARGINQAWTVIIGCKRTATGDGGAASDHLFTGLYRAANGTTNGPAILARLNQTFRAIQGVLGDHNNNYAFDNQPYPISASGPYGIAFKGDGVNQSGFIRVGGSNTHTFPASPPATTENLSTSSLSDVDRLVVDTANDWPFQYMFVYDTALSDANIQSIIDAPGEVLTQAGGDASVALAGSAISQATGTPVPVFSIGL